MVYSGSYYHKSFSLISNGMISVPEMSLEIDTICDFEILDGEVFFCGRTVDNNTKKGVLGIFSLNDFPQSNIHLYILPDLSCLTELEIKYYNNEKHVIMIGLRPNGISTLVDACSNGYSWYFAALPGEDTVYYTDIVLIDNFIVATSHEGFASMAGKTWFYPAPPPSNNAFLTGNVFFTQRASAIPSLPMKVERYGSNRLVVMENEGYYLNNIHLIDYNVTVPGTIVTMNISSNFKICDAKFDYGERVLGLLLKINSLSSYTNIYCFDLSTFSLGGTVSSRQCGTLSLLHSLDNVPGQSSLFVSSGQSGTPMMDLINYNFNAYQNGVCTIPSIKEVHLHIWDGKTGLKDFYGNIIPVVYKGIQGYEKIHQREILCSDEKEKSELENK